MANRTLLLCLVLSISLACYFESAVGSPERGGYSSRSSKPSSSSSGSSWSSWNSKPSYPDSRGFSGYGTGSGSSGNSKPSYPDSRGFSGYGTGSGSSWNSKPSYPESGGFSGYETGSGSSWSSKPSYPESGGFSGYGTSSGSSGNSKPSYPESGGFSGYGTGSGSSGNSKPSYPESGGFSGYGTGSGSSIPSYTQSGKPPSSSNSGSSWSWWDSGSSSSSDNDYGIYSYSPSHGEVSGTTRPIYTLAPLPAGVKNLNSFAGMPTGRLFEGLTMLNNGTVSASVNKHYGDHNAKPSYTNNNNHHSGTHGTSPHAGAHVTNEFSTPYTSPQYLYVTDYRNSGSRYGDLLTGLTLYNMGRSHSHYENHYYDDDYYRRRYNSEGNVKSYYSPEKTAVCTMRITENGNVETLMIPCEIVSTFTNEGKQVRIPQSQVDTTCVSTNCTFTVNATDPLMVKGPPLNTSKMQCEVEIRTRELRTTNKVDCDTLVRYSKMPEPKRDSIILPEKQKLKELLHNPPWWMSLIIAV